MQPAAQRLSSSTGVSHRGALPYLRWHNKLAHTSYHAQFQHRRTECSSVSAVKEQVQQTCPWSHGVSTLQGPRDDMEDDTCVIWDQESSSLFLGKVGGVHDCVRSVRHTIYSLWLAVGVRS